MQPYEELTLPRGMWRAAPPVEESLPRAEWDEEAHYPAELVIRHQGNPCVARLESGDGAWSDLGPLVEEDTAVLVYSQRRRTKVYAENMWWDYSSSSYIRKGPLLEIPKDYSGWFEAIPDDNGPSQHYSSVEEIAETKCRLFLVRSTVACFLTCQDEDGNLTIQEETRIYPGEVLRAIKVVKKRWKTKIKDSATQILENSGVAETRLLMCKNWRRQEVCLPLAHPGKFNVIANKQVPGVHVVYQIRDIIRRLPLPLNVRLVFGTKPATPCQFGGILRLMEYHRPDSLVLYAFTTNKHALLELPFDAEVKLRAALNKETMEASVAYKAAVDACKRLVYPYVIGLKPLELAYKTRELKDPPQEKGMHTGFLGTPVDMCLFNPMDIFPPLEEEEGRVSDSWTLSFKDPESLENGIQSINLGGTYGDSEDTEPRPDGSTDVLSQVSSQSSESGELPAKRNTLYPEVVGPTSAHDVAMRNYDVRKSRVEEHWKRASRC